MKMRKSILPILLVISLFIAITATAAIAAYEVDPNIDLAKTNWGTTEYSSTGPALSYYYSFGRNWSTTPSDGISRASTPSAVGTLKVAIIFMDCTDALAANVTQRTPVDYRTTEANFAVLEPLIDFYRQSSYGQLEVELINVNELVNDGEWFHGTRTASSYNSSMSTQANEAIAFAAAAGFDFSDINYPAVFSPRNATAISSSITSHSTLTLPLPEESGYTSKTTSQYFNIGYNIWSWRRPWTVLAHEMGHTLNMIDLYTYDYVVNETTNSGSQWFQFIGGWDLEGDCNAHSPDQLAWHKWKVRWLKDEQVKVVVPNSSQIITLTANAYWDEDSDDRAADGIKMIYIPTETLRPGTSTKTETGYVIESRRPIGNDAPGPVAPGGSQTFGGAQDQGVLIYRIDSLGPNTTNGGHGRGGVKVINGRPDGVNNRTQTSSNGLQTPCFGFNTGQVQTFRDEERNITIQVLYQDDLTDTVLVIYGDPTITASEEYVFAGNTATVEFTLGNNIGITSAGIEIGYNPSLVKPVSFNTENLPENLAYINLDYAPGVARFTFASTENLNLEDDTFFSITFEPVAGNALVFDAGITITPKEAAVEYNAIEMGPQYQAYNSSGTATHMMNRYLRLQGVNMFNLEPINGAVSLVVLGDVSGEGLVTVEDAILLLQYYVGLIDLSAKQLFCANVSGNNNPGPTDAALILRMVVGN